MAKLGDLVVNIGANTKDLNKKLGKVRREVRSMGSNFKAVGQSMTKSLTLPLVAIGAAAIKSSADLETLETSFISLTGGAKQAADMMQQLNEFTASTPFQIDAVAKSARQLIASGTDISKVNKQLQFLGDIAATSGSSIDEIAAIFSKVQAKGKVELESLNQLAERGIPIFTALSKATGLPAAELGAGAVSVEQFNQVLKSFAEEGGFAAGAMERLSETASGKFSTALDNLKLAGAELVSSLMPALKGAIDRVTELAQKFTSLSDGSKQTILAFGAIVAALGPLLIMLPNMIAGFTAMRNAFVVLNATMLANPFIAIAAGATALTLALVSLTDTTSDAKKNVDEFISTLDGLGKKQTEVGITTRIELLKTEKVQLEVAARAEAAAAKVGALGDKFDKQIASGNTQRYTEQAANLAEEIALLNVELDNLTNPVEKVAEVIDSSADTTTKATSSVLKYVDAIESIPASLIEINGLNKELQISTTNVGDTLEEATSKTQNMQFAILGLAETMGGMFSDLVTNSAKGANAFKQFAIRGMRAAIALAKAQVIANATGPNAANVASGGLATPAFIVAGLTMLDGFLSTLPALAEGGLAFGPTTALIGDNKNARIDPEVVAPLSKLRDMLGSGSTNVYGRISGDDIVISNDRAMRDRNRYI